MTGYEVVTFDLGDTMESRGSNLGDAQFRIRQFVRWAADRDRVGGARTDDLALAFHAVLREQRIGSDLRHREVRDIAERMARAAGFEPTPLDVAELAELLQDPGPDERLSWAPGLPEVLSALRAAGVRLGVISNLRLTSGANVRRVLRRAGLLDFFDPAGLTFSDELGVHKPHPEIFETTLRRLGAPAAAAVHVGDNWAADVVGARAVGMTTVRFTGLHDDERIEGPDADHLLAALSGLPAVLGIEKTRAEVTG
ncbi:HAD family hydrolase [Nocardia wallacei]|uniref:HAD family hydrolase n=1 Tax=Nocardia wallacei TaxID=480035 RepID=UPI0024538AE7|nr:HAD family hydrolase [Nocardia wallacei]